MSDDDPDLAPVTEDRDYAPILDAVIPAAMLAVAAGYAWSLRDIVNPEMNLLLLKPLFVVIAVLLLVVAVKEVIPALRAQVAAPAGRSSGRVTWRQRFAPGSEATAGLVVLLTFVFAFLGPGRGVTVYLAGLFAYLTVAGWLLGDRRPVVLFGRSALCALGLYFVMGVLLGVRL